MHVSRFVIIAMALVGLAARAERPHQASSAKQPAVPLRETATGRAIAQLNECIQERFKDVDERFGFTRVIRIGATPHRFVPETVREMSVVRELERDRLEVVLYLAGRQVLGQNPASWHPVAADGWGPVKGPVGVTSTTGGPIRELNSQRAPLPRGLRENSRRAFAAFEARESYDFETAGWQISARPIRASSEMCLQCHSERDHGGSFFRRMPAPRNDASLRVGDPLGVVMYAHRPAR